jgi:hypothetical protein
MDGVEDRYAVAAGKDRAALLRGSVLPWAKEGLASKDAAVRPHRCSTTQPTLPAILACNRTGPRRCRPSSQRRAADIREHVVR